MTASSTSINHFSLALAAQEILLRFTDDKEYTEEICEFLDGMRCRSVVTIANLSVIKGEILTAFGEFVTTRLRTSTHNRPPHSLIVMFASTILEQLIDGCVHDSHKHSSSPPDTPVATVTPQLKRQSSESSSSPPSKRIKTLDPAKLLLLNVDHPQFWQFMLAFTSLFDPAHAAELACPGCGNTYMVNNPHNFYTHVSSKHEGACHEARVGCTRTPPVFPPAGDSCHTDLSALSECALMHVPLPWLAAMPITSLPAGIQSRIHSYSDSQQASQLSVATSPVVPLLQAHGGDLGNNGLDWPTPLSGL